MRSPGTAIRMRRLELGLSDVEVATRSGLSVDEYWDLERNPEEIYMVTCLADIGRVCRILGLRLGDVFQLPQCTQRLEHDSIQRRREELGWSASELSNRVGISEVTISQAESSPATLQTWVLDPVLALAHVLKLRIECVLDLAFTSP